MKSCLTGTLDERMDNHHTNKQGGQVGGWCSERVFFWFSDLHMHCVGLGAAVGVLDQGSCLFSCRNVSRSEMVSRADHINVSSALLSAPPDSTAQILTRSSFSQRGCCISQTVTVPSTFSEERVLGSGDGTCKWPRSDIPIRSHSRTHDPETHIPGSILSALPDGSGRSSALVPRDGREAIRDQAVGVDALQLLKHSESWADRARRR